MPPKQQQQSKPPDINGLLDVVQRREEQEDDILNNFEDWEEEENDEPPGVLSKTMINEPSQTWIKLTNFNRDEFMDIFREFESESSSERRRGHKPIVSAFDGLLALLILYKTGIKLEDLGMKVRYRTTALSNALNRTRPLLNKILKRRWWNDRKRPIPLEEMNFPFIALLTDVNSIEVYRPIGRFEDSKIYFDGKNWMYAIKFEVAVSASPPHYAQFVFKGRVGSTHDFTIHKGNFEQMIPYLRKMEGEIPIIVSNRNNRYWAILEDKAYEAGPNKTPDKRRIFIKKQPMTNLEKSNNVELKRLKVPVECFFGRMWQLWSLLRKPYPFSHDWIDLDYENMVLLTNEHIRATHPLEEGDQTRYKAFREERKRRYEARYNRRRDQQMEYAARKRRRFQNAGFSSE